MRLETKYNHAHVSNDSTEHASAYGDVCKECYYPNEMRCTLRDKGYTLTCQRCLQEQQQQQQLLLEKVQLRSYGSNCSNRIGIHDTNTQQAYYIDHDIMSLPNEPTNMTYNEQPDICILLCSEAKAEYGNCSTYIKA